ncbi:MAG TPA: general stress protein [Pseudolysinimonas sp.]|nr:general stress protein [Pseudolysinimonas sp.]
MSNPGAGRGAASRQVNFQSVPKGEVLGTYDTYLEAQERVDHLAKADFPVGKVSIVGNDLKSVERVTRKLSWSRAAIEGALSGAWFGLFIGVVLTFFSPTINWGFFLAAILIGAAFGMLFRLVSYGISRRSRDFESTNQVLASNYQVIVDPEFLDKARDALARPKAD